MSAPKMEPVIMPTAEKKRLTDTLATKAKPRSELYEITDVGEPGLRLRVSPLGTKTFTLRYRFASKSRREVLGRFGEITVDEARDRAREIKRAARDGDDLRAINEAQRIEAAQKAAGERSFSYYAEQFLEENPIKSAAARRNLFDTHILPQSAAGGIGDIPLAKISRKQIKLFLTDKQKERRRRGGAGTDGKPATLGAQVNRIQSAIKSVTAWAVEEEHIEADPLAGMKRVYGEKRGRTRIEAPRDRVLSDAEIKTLWSATDSLGYPRGHAVKMLLLTGCRLREIGELQWPEIDLEGGLITIQANRMKNKAPHTIPIVGHMQTILEEIRGFGFSGPCVFSTTHGHKPYQGWSKAKIQFDKLTDFTTPWVYHDIRRTVRSGLPKLGISRDISERVLAHTPGKLEQVYDHHDYIDQKRNALDAWSAHVLSIVEGREAPSNVEDLAQRRA